MRWLSYLLLALRRFVSWRSSEAFIQWKLRLLLLCMQAIPLISAVHWILELNFVSPNPHGLALLVVLPLVVGNEIILSRHRPEKYARDFAALPRAHRAAVYLTAALLVAVVFILPFIVHKLELGRWL
jgi:hypothetical protein